MKETKDKRPRCTVRLVGLEGRRRKVTRAVCATSRTNAIEWLKQGYAITAAGDDGSISVWIDDDGLYRCEFYQYKATKAALTTHFIATVDQWLRVQWPLMHRTDSSKIQNPQSKIVPP